MKQLSFAFLLTINAFCALSQRTVALRNLWAEPNVHVLFDGYTLSFTIKDIDRALQLLAETGDSTYGVTSGLDTAKQYTVELYPGYNTEYRNRLQPLLQQGVATYLLIVGHAEVENSRHRKLKDIVVDAMPPDEGEKITDIKFYDSKTGKLLFNGRMAMEMYNKDIGIE